MTVRAIASITATGSGSVGIQINGDGTQNYVLTITGSVYDDVAGPVTNNPGGFSLAPVLVSTALSFKKANRAIRVAVAAQILSQRGLIIDPDDIYIPFASD